MLVVETCRGNRSGRSRQASAPVQFPPRIQAAGRADGRAMFSALKAWARAVKLDIVALWIAARDPRVPWHAKVVAGLVAAYELSPIDLIPDFIPVLGYLDDIIIVPLGILLAVRLIPDPLLREFRAEALRRERPVSRGGIALVVAGWFAAIAVLVWLFWPAGTL